MPTVRKLLVAPLILLMMLTSPAFADQRHAVDPSQLAAAVDQHVAKQDADRAALREALARPEVQTVAAKIGVDLTRAADAARQVNQQFVGGASTVVISTTTIIIVLLLIVLIIVLVK